MDCREARELLQDELDGRLDAAAAARLAAHVASCAACADEKRGLASLRATFRAMPRPAAPVGFAGGVMSSLPAGRVRNLPRVLGLLVAAAAVVVVCVTLIPSSRMSAPAEREVAATSRVALRTRVPAEEKAQSSPDEVLIPEAEKALADEDAEADAKPAAKAALPAPAPATPPAARPPRDEAAVAKKAAAVAPPAVRYVVFRDAAAAEQFAKELAAGDAWKVKDKNVEPGVVNVDPGFVGGGKGDARGGPDADDARRRDAAVDLTKEAAAATHRVVARASVAAADVDSALAVEATRAGGSLVPRAETSKFAAVVEPPAPSAFSAKAPETKADAGDDARKAEEKSKASGALALPAGKSAPPRVVVVIVVLEPSAPTSPR